MLIGPVQLESLKNLFLALVLPAGMLPPLDAYKIPLLKLSMKKTGGIFHDRFIVLDYGTADERVFLCGASSKDAGARITSIVEDYGIAKYNSVIAGLLKNSPLVLPK